jgi:hypothetical protein
MPDPVATTMDEVVRDATAGGTIASAAIFVVAPGMTALRLQAAAGIEGRALEGLTAAVAHPDHPVARSFNDRAPTFDVLPVNPGGPRLRSHLPLVAVRNATASVVGVLAVAHDEPLGDEERTRLIGLAQRAADAAAS